MSKQSDLESAVEQGKAIFEAGMETGRHSLRRRLKDFSSPVGNSTGLVCVARGHKWYLGNPRSMQYGGGMKTFTTTIDPDTGEEEVVVIEPEFPENPPWSCFCVRCGAGSYFDDPPEECFEIEYWCYTCESVVPGKGIIDHAKDHLKQRGSWPTYNRASVHAPASPKEDNRE